jgi:hypothetical protein
LQHRIRTAVDSPRSNADAGSTQWTKTVSRLPFFSLRICPGNRLWGCQQAFLRSPHLL